MHPRHFLPLLALTCFLGASAPPPPLSNGPPRSAADEQSTFRVPEGFRVELVAQEPNIIDPVAMCFDERGRIFVAEMRGYPNGGRGTGVISSGRIRLLEDRDGDGVYETATVWADKLRFPTGLTPWKGGLLVANAPDLLYLEDPSNTGKATKSTVLYTGFHTANIQQLLNSLQFAHDNWIHACAGGGGGKVTSKQVKMAPVDLRGRGIRFRPDVPGSLEPTSGGGQYGLAPDAFGRWFTATNSNHLRHIILPDHYLKRNPSLAVRAVTLDIPEHGAACKVFRASPFEAWRIERTRRRAGSAAARSFPPTELFPGGYSTSSCSPLVYEADLFPPQYRGSVFICDPANNLIMRDTLTPKGATYVAKRGHDKSEFFTSTDNYCRPVHLTLGPDGAIYFLDFYREVIETPLSLPEDIKVRVNSETRLRGRIWRITTAKKGTKPPKVQLHKETLAQLVAHLADANLWWRSTAQRLLIERGDKKAIPLLEKLVRSTTSAPAKVHALWTLEGLGALPEKDILLALKDKEPGVREQALRLSETRLKKSKTLAVAVAGMTDDPSPRVRFQLAFSLGEMSPTQAAPALAKLAKNRAVDSWTETAILSSTSGGALPLLEALAKEKGTDHLPMLTRLAAVVGAKASDDDLARVFTLLGKVNRHQDGPVAILDGLGQGMRNSRRTLAEVCDNPPASLKAGAASAIKVFERSARIAADDKASSASRLASVRLLGYGPYATLAKIAPDLLSPKRSPEMQLATVRALAAQGDAKVSSLILTAWNEAGPTLRREMIETLLGRKDRVLALLSALKKKTIKPNQIDAARLALLKRYPDPAIRARVAQFLASLGTPARAKIVKEYQSAFDLKTDLTRGKAIFKKTCAACHQLEGVGKVVGADLKAALRTKTASGLVVDILDPNREVDPRYLTYQVTTKRGQVLSGIIAAETATSVTLKRGEGAEDTVLRSQIDKIEATGQSLMPEGLEKELKKQDLADLIAYLLKVK